MSKLKQSVLSWWHKEGFTKLDGDKPEFVKVAEDITTDEGKDGYVMEDTRNLLHPDVQLTDDGFTGSPWEEYYQRDKKNKP